ncbi:ferrous iron transport protein B [Akkermansiaceae bacterium]|nr:ferrous iron transport protein B [Akkermansiaceae bacterium]
MSEQTSEARVALVGHPNAGKTTLFNALTGQRQKVGNYTGVTVEKTTGEFYTPHGVRFEVIDLPGCYSLAPNSPDEMVTRDVLLGVQEGEAAPDLVLCVLDASNLERHLYLLLQVIDLGYPVVAALNKIDQAEAQGLRLEPTALSETFGVPFVPLSALTEKGFVALKQSLRFPLPTAPDRHWKGSHELEEALTNLEKIAGEAKLPRPAGQALQLLSDPTYSESSHLPEKVQSAAQEQGSFEANISQLRSEFVQRGVDAGLRRPDEKSLQLTDKIDAYALHRIGGWGIFIAMMLTVFWTIFRFAEVPMGWIEAGQGALGSWVGSFFAEGDFRDLIVDGIIGGVGSVVVFLPQILLLFFFISLLESSGYMTRAAYLMDGVMSKVGLSGKSFLPLLSGYACAIPGVMATRSIPSAKERLATILILPWTSCTARLPVYILLMPLLMPGAGSQALLLFGIYALGTLTALLAAKILRPRLGPIEPAQFMLELPPYQKPQWGFILRQVFERAFSFLKKAGTIILGISILLWFLETYPKSDSDDPAVQREASFMGMAGQVIEPVVEPLGWDARTGTAMLTSFAAREVFVSSLAISYSVDEEEEGAEDRLRDKLANAKRADGSPLFTPLTALSLLIFFIYALQCLPTTAVVRRETNSWKWALGQLGGMTLFAYLAALAVFQIGSLF